MIQKYYKIRIHDRSTWIPFLVLLLFSIISMLVPGIVDQAPWDFETYHFFDAYFAASFYYFPVSLLQIPLYFVYLLVNHSFFSNTAVYLRFSGVRSYWNKRLLTLAMDAALFVLVLYLLLLSNFVFFGQMPALQGHGVFLLKSIFSQILAYYVLGILFSFFSFCFRSPIWGFCCTYALVAVEFAVVSTRYDAVPMLFLKAICMDATHLAGYWSTVLLMIGLAGGLLLLAPPLLDGRDCLTKEVS